MGLHLIYSPPLRTGDFQFCIAVDQTHQSLRLALGIRPAKRHGTCYTAN
jgi:hypothetical protein